MCFNSNELVLSIIHMEGGTIQGKTLIQSKAYFVGIELDLDLDYNTQYFGTYSSTINSSTGNLFGLGFVDEHLNGFGKINQNNLEIKKYDYCLTDDGKIAAEQIINKNSECYESVKKVIERIRDAGNPSSTTLSTAANLYQTYCDLEIPLTRETMEDSERYFNWSVPEQKTEVKTFFEKMGIIK